MRARMRGATAKRLLGVVAAAGLLIAGHATVSSASSTPGLDKLRAATDKYHNLSVATHHGYAILKDLNGIACIADDQPPMDHTNMTAAMKMQMQMGSGAMGIHYANGELVGNLIERIRKPEALLYAPDKRGNLHLAGVEYVVIKAAWDASHSSPPKLFGHQFNFTDAGNRFGLPPFYSLHVWVWKDNPAGMFAMFNPDVHCPAA